MDDHVPVGCPERALAMRVQDGGGYIVIWRAIAIGTKLPLMPRQVRMTAET